MRVSDSLLIGTMFCVLSIGSSVAALRFLPDPIAVMYAFLGIVGFVGAWMSFWYPESNGDSKGAQA